MSRGNGCEDPSDPAKLCCESRSRVRRSSKRSCREPETYHEQGEKAGCCFFSPRRKRTRGVSNAFPFPAAGAGR